MTLEQTKFARKLVKAIKAEPKHINMRYFNDNTNKIMRIINMTEAEVKRKIGVCCGTVNCIAGLALVMKYGREDAPYIGIYEDEAAKILGLPDEVAYALFYFSLERPEVYVTNESWAFYADERRAIKKLTPGTQEYADVVAGALEKTIKVYGYKGTALTDRMVPAHT